MGFHRAVAVFEYRRFDGVKRCDLGIAGRDISYPERQDRLRICKGAFGLAKIVFSLGCDCRDLLLSSKPD